VDGGRERSVGWPPAVVEAGGGGRSAGQRLGLRVSGWWRRRSPATTMTASMVELGLGFGGPGLRRT
jgi:hypothetical protein